MATRALFLGPALCAISIFLVSCGDSGTEGVIGNGSFGYACVSNRDPACSMDGNFVNSYLKTIPPEIAVGSHFGIGFISESDVALSGSAVIAPVSSELIAQDSIGFIAKKAGYAGIVAKRGSGILDLLHVHFESIASVGLGFTGSGSGGGIPNGGSIDISPGALIELTATPLSADSAVLAGSPDDAWSADNPTVAELIAPTDSNSISIRGGALGESMVHVNVGGVTRDVLIRVVDPGSGAGGGGGGSSSSGGGAGGAGGSP